VIGLAFAAVFIILNGFFVAAEFAFVKLHATQLQSRVRQGDKRAIAAREVLSRLDRYLTVTQFGVTLASLGLGWIGEPALEHIVDGWTEPLTRGSAATSRAVHVGGIVVAFTALTYMHVLLGELVPKLLAIQRSDRMALAAATPLRVLYTIFRPALFLLEKASRVVLRLLGMSATERNEGSLSEEQIAGVLAAYATSGPRGKETSALVERVIRFSQRTARHAMVPRVDVASLPIDTPRADAMKFLRAQQYSRILLTKERSLDEIAGYLYVKHLLLGDEDKELDDGALARHRRDVLFVPETQGLLDVMRSMQESHTPIAVVVDEYGGTSGIVTMEDLLEEIVGEIRDELDEEPARLVKVQGEEAWDVDARAPMDELRPIGVAVEADDAAEPVGAVLVNRLGRLPRKGDQVSIAPNAVGIVSSLSRRRITRVRVRLVPPTPAASS
jgi:CBS domain containing-hemolysin-like protein